MQPLSDSSPAFIGAPAVYSKLGGAPSSGKGVIVGVLDSGPWPEHPQFAAPAGLPAPPAKADGTARTCDFGDNPVTPAADVFTCDNKLISGQPFLDTYNAVVGGEVYPDSARDSNGHGTHTATTSAGGPVADANPLGISRGPIHGVAPAAHIAVYKVCGAEGCYQSDSAQAVAQRVLDGVRVINFSISGGADPYSDPVEPAFLDAYAAGVFVAASAGNAGPGAATADHLSPWVTTVAASTQTRTFRSTISLSGGTTLTGASVTEGVPAQPASGAGVGPAVQRRALPEPRSSRPVHREDRGLSARAEPGAEGVFGTSGRRRRDDPLQRRAATGCRPCTSTSRPPTSCSRGRPRTGRHRVVHPGGEDHLAG